MKKGYIILISLTAAFVGVLLGLYIGRNAVNPVPDNSQDNVVVENFVIEVNGTETRNKININTATKEDLLNLPGIGEVLAQSIIDYREENGGFKDLEELLNIKNIGQTRYNELSKYLYIPD